MINNLNNPFKGYFFCWEIIKFIMNEKRLSQCKLKKNYKICRIEIKDKNLFEQLKNLGIVVGREIEFKTSNYGKKSFMVSVMGINYALDKAICENIWVNEK